MPTAAHTVWRHACLVLLVALALALSSCASSSASRRFSPPYMASVLVSFAPSVPYKQALRLVTDLGLQPGIDCGVGGGAPSEQTRSVWQSMGQRQAYSQTRVLLVVPAQAPDDWWTRLLATPGVLDAQEGQPVGPQGSNRLTPTVRPTYPCVVAMVPVPVPAGTPLAMSAAEAGAFARISFASPLDTYDAALYAISDLGLHLADPCNEQAVGNAPPPAWHPVGEEASFSTSHMLVVQTSLTVTSTLWQSQLKAARGVLSIQVPYTARC
jgi:hypothetical protein